MSRSARRGGATGTLPVASCLLVGLVLIGAEQLAADGTEQALGHAAVNPFAGLCVLAGLQRHRPPRPLAWRALAVSMFTPARSAVLVVLFLVNPLVIWLAIDGAGAITLLGSAAASQELRA